MSYEGRDGTERQVGGQSQMGPREKLWTTSSTSAGERDAYFLDLTFGHEHERGAEQMNVGLGAPSSRSERWKFSRLISRNSANVLVK